jgi:2-aminoadipate transaminase
VDPEVAALQRTAAERKDVIGLSGGLPDTELMPREEIAVALAAVVRRADEALQYAWPEGVARLRAWIAKRLSARGADVSADDVIVTSGAQQALSLIGMAHRGKRIAVGEATYPAAIAAFERAGAEAVVDDGDARYVMPGVANPSGRELLAGMPGGVVIADEAYTELRYDGTLPRPLVADARDRVWHIGTLSKTVAPGLRVGWLVPPRGEHQELIDLKEASDLQTASVTQEAAAYLLTRFDYDAHIERSRAAYRKRCEVFCTALHEVAPQLAFDEPAGGFSAWIELPDERDELALLERAIENGVSFDPGRGFRPPGSTGPSAIRASFSNAPIDQLAEGARRLATTLGASASRRHS